ncbi:Serine/threonine-protein kinase STE20 [Trichoderma ghanense]|uniref:Serine/threonine-protein kinase STE20 n=1 Tax=Trichoderma ghanense TaxID=65468 RepID=A0ABY2HJD0_9HYPO
MALSSAESSLSFATLTPESKVAQTHLASLVAKHRSDAVGSPMDLVVATRHLTNIISSDDHDPASRSKYTIIFTFGRKGHGRDSEWIVGKLNSDKHGKPIDMPISSSRSRCIKGRKLFEVFIHPKSGVLMIRNANANHSLWYLNADNQGDHVELRNQERYVLHMSTNLLRIGSLDYALRYSIESTRAFLASRKVYMQRQLGDWDVPSCFAIQPRHDHIRLRHVILHSVIAKGGTCVVRAGVDRKTGNPIACKTMQCSRGNIEAAVNEISIASVIAAHALSGLVPLLFKSCGHGHPLPCSQAELEDMHLVMPYAPFTFDTAPWQEIRPSVKLALFRHALEGLKNLHAAGIMHRDIDPSNLLVFSLQPAAAAIGDFGMAKVGSQGVEKSLGSLAYQAPEVATRETYTEAIDIFSMALSILATFEGCIWSGPLSDHEHYSALLNYLTRLETRMPAGLATVLRAMLSWDPSHRPSAEDVLTDAVWEQIAEPDSVRTSDRQSDRQSSEKSSSMQQPDDDLPLPGSDAGDGLDRRLRSPIPEALPRSSSPNSNTSSADDLDQRMKRSHAPPPSSVGNDDADSTAEVHGRDDMSERMNRSEAPSPASAANGET